MLTKLDMGQIINTAMSKSEITQENAEILTALAMADKPEDYIPIGYPAPSGNLKLYVFNRIKQLASRDSVLAIKNGEWLQLMVKLRTQNIATYDLCVWAVRKCEDANKTEKLSTLREMVKKCVCSYGEVDWDYFKQALEVQKMDETERRRNNKI